MEDELIRFIGECLKVKIGDETIGDLKWDFNHFAPVPNINKYDDLTVNQYIIYYKINRMEELGLITKDLRNELIELVNKYLEINVKINKEVYKEMIDEKYKSNVLQELLSICYEIKTKLSQYFLDDEKIDLCQIIDNQMIMEFENKGIKKLKT